MELLHPLLETLAPSHRIGADPGPQNHEMRSKSALEVGAWAVKLQAYQALVQVGRIDLDPRPLCIRAPRPSTLVSWIPDRRPRS
eukprot:2665030-Rhodomonas_salina.1